MKYNNVDPLVILTRKNVCAKAVQIFVYQLEYFIGFGPEGRFIQLYHPVKGVSHIIVKILESFFQSASIIIVLNDMTRTCSELKFIILSVTVVLKCMSKYFNNCNIVEIDGRTYPLRMFLGRLCSNE